MKDKILKEAIEWYKQWKRLIIHYESFPVLQNTKGVFL